MALHRLRADPSVEIVALLTTVSPRYDRVSIHGVRRVLLHAQAAAVGLPVIEAPLPEQPDNAAYEASFAAAVEEARARFAGLGTVAFGDLFLADIRAYREGLLARLGMRARFPLWGEPTGALARAVVATGYRATVVCVDLARLSADFAGQEYSDGFLDRLPSGVDPCAERGEFHTFVTDGPIFASPVRVQPGDTVIRDGYAYADLLPAGEGERGGR
jgi:uncharacterized protein (TIGR00290 family)